MILRFKTHLKIKVPKGDFEIKFKAKWPYKYTADHKINKQFIY